MGMAYQMLQDVKARMLVLEQQAASKETVAAVTARLYPNMGHGINADEVAFVQGMMASLL